MPKYRPDHTAYTTPIGPTQLKQFADSVRSGTPWAKVINYRDANEGHNALKLIDQHEWEVRWRALVCAFHAPDKHLSLPSSCAQGDRPAADIRLAYSRTKDAQEEGAKGELEGTLPEAPPGQVAAPQRRGVHIRFIWSQKTRNYIRRMVPHILGWFPISAAWVMIINALETARRDLADVSEEEIPLWVLGAIYGTFVIVRHSISFSNLEHLATQRNPSHAVTAVHSSGRSPWYATETPMPSTVCHSSATSIPSLMAGPDPLPVVLAGLLLQGLAARTDCLAK